MYVVPKSSIPCVAVGIFLVAESAMAEKQVLVVDPRGQAVPSDIVRMAPSPETPLGRTDATGKLVLAKECTAGSILRAEPSAEYVTHGSTCSGHGRSVKIEVTPIAVLANLEGNLEAAQRAGNQAAIAQIAGELAERTNFKDADKAMHYKNVAAVALANTYAPTLHEKTIYIGAEVGHIRWNPDRPIVWADVCDGKTRLLKCSGTDKDGGVIIQYTRKLEGALEQDPTAPPIKMMQTDKNSWLKKYSGQQTSEFLYHSIDSNDSQIGNHPMCPLTELSYDILYVLTARSSAPLRTFKPSSPRIPEIPVSSNYQARKSPVPL